MDPEAWIAEEPRPQRSHSTAQIAAAWLIGVAFALTASLAVVLPAISAVAFVLGFELRAIVGAIVLWSAVATVAGITFVVITRSFVGLVLGHRLR